MGGPLSLGELAVRQFDVRSAYGLRPFPYGHGSGSLVLPRVIVVASVWVALTGGTVKDIDRTKPFNAFLDNVSRLLADDKLREVLHELDSEGEEAFDLLATDPAAFLRYQGVAIPDDYRVSVTRQPEEAAATKGTTATIYCLRICWWRWCFTICIVIIRTTTA